MIKKHEFFMKKCLELASKGIGLVNPNPMVGSVIVKDNNIISKGFHRKFGEYHAERNAILNSKVDVSGATLYVNLQPCNHHGKTPPCTQIIKESGIKKVVYSVNDPNEDAVKDTDDFFRNNNIEFEKGILLEESVFLNRVFFHNILRKRPYVFAKWAQTIDGKIADHRMHSKFITGKSSREYVHRLRYEADGILVGINTVLYDDPMLNIRFYKDKSIKRIVLDNDGRIPLDSSLVRSAQEYPLIIICKNIDSKKLKKLNEKNVKVYMKKDYNLIDILKDLYKKERICNIMVEGGSKVLGSFFREDLIDELYVFIAPKISGDNNSLTCVQRGQNIDIDDFKNYSFVRNEKFENDIMINYVNESVKCLPELLKK